jgi:hypothetical protein
MIFFHHDFLITKRAFFPSIIHGNGVHCVERLISFERYICRRVEINAAWGNQGNVKKFSKKSVSVMETFGIHKSE